MVKRLETSRHDPLGITDSACKNQLVVVSVQYGPFNTYIPIRSTTIGKSRVARDPIAMHTSWRSNSEITSVTRVSMTFRVVRTNQYNQDLGLIHSTKGNHLKSPNEGSSIDHQVTIHLHAQNITMFPTNETWYFTSLMLVSSSGGLILILTAQSTRNGFIIHRIQLAVGPQPLWLRNHNSGLAHRIMVKRLATSPHDPLGITDSACKNQLVVVSVQYGPFNPYIPFRSTTIGKSRVAIDPIAMHTSWRSNSDIVSVTSIGYPRMSASGESSTTMHRLLHASGSHPIPTPYDPK
ncbi:triacylglycerol lipase [Dorcoceras hygrometricum]|uniref:Triacylglycerol lipase n=1 Tax=Dorcoceras hygrometricum TaxID=472368 RepID=A0A2Z7AMD2_9LAMI|nr:triacylglycerol lipase [Dorcoceras hygrometricum]